MKVLLVMESCPHCHEELRKRAEEIEKGELKVFDVSKDEDAYRFVLAMKMPFVPNLLDIETDEDRVKICRLDRRNGEKRECRIVEL